MRKQGAEQIKNGQEGMVLILVLVLLGLIVSLIVQAQIAAILNLKMRSSELKQAQLREVLTTSVLQALQVLADDDVLTVDHPAEAWAEPIEEEYPSGISVWVRIYDGNSRFDLNNIYTEKPVSVRNPPTDVLMSIMTLCGDYAPVERVDAILDWIDPGTDGFRESDYYLRKESPYTTSDYWLNSWEEAAWVEGFSYDYFLSSNRDADGPFQGDLTECLTLTPGRRAGILPVNVNSAPQEVLVGIVGLEYEAWVQKILILRQAQPIIVLEPLLMVAEGLDAEAVRPYIDVKSTVFCVKASAFYDSDTADLWALVRRGDDGELTITRWVM